MLNLYALNAEAEWYGGGRAGELLSLLLSFLALLVQKYKY
jgi:hypothetical protein